MTTADSSDPHTLLMDAAERLIIERGYDAISTRVVAAEAGVNHGLVHYYFGSVSNLLVATLDRFTERILKRQRALYAEDRPFIEKWRDAMGYLRGDDPESGYSKLWMEMQAMSWNHPEILEHVQDTALKWRALLTDAFSDAMTDYGIDRELFPVEALVALVMTFNEGLQLEQLGGINDGHSELLATIDRMLVGFEAGKD